MKSIIIIIFIVTVVTSKTPAPNGACQGEYDPGPCDDYCIRYYYDSESRQCKKFVYGGCGGNCNRYLTKKECLENCQDGIEKNCFDPPETGPCRARMTRYYYNRTTKRCHQFVYGGCGGNGNNYSTKEQCMKYCRGH